MSTAAADAVPPLSPTERGLLATVGVGAVGVGGLGLVSSMDAVSDTARRWGFSEPWMLPVAIDLAIPVFTGAHLLLVRLGMPLVWVRFVPWALTAVTGWLNVAAGDSTSARIAHGTMPLLWVVLSEIAAHVYAVRVGVATGRRRERIRRSRWLLAPASTFAVWRRMLLWEVTDYRQALALERERQLVRAELRERHGRGWRRKAPRRTRVLLRLGDVVLEAAEESAGPDPAAPSGEPRRRQVHRTARTRTAEELFTEARARTAAWSDQELTADAIRKAVRTSQANARTLRDALRAERRGAAEPVETPA